MIEMDNGNVPSPLANRLDASAVAYVYPKIPYRDIVHAGLSSLFGLT
jgi:hypothetical protein